jgi:hypothetical protein
MYIDIYSASSQSHGLAAAINVLYAAEVAVWLKM